MNLKFRDDDLIVFLNQKEIEKINFENQKELKKYFKNLFLKIKKIYNIKLKGSYEIIMYIDKKMGIILEMKKEKIEYFEYEDEVIDMKIKQEENEFIFEIENNIEKIKNKINTFIRKNKIYVKPKKLNQIEQGILLENSKIIYGEKLKKIINDLELVKLDKIW